MHTTRSKPSSRRRENRTDATICRRGGRRGIAPMDRTSASGNPARAGRPGSRDVVKTGAPRRAPRRRATRSPPPTTSMKSYRIATRIHAGSRSRPNKIPSRRRGPGGRSDLVVQPDVPARDRLPRVPLPHEPMARPSEAAPEGRGVEEDRDRGRERTRVLGRDEHRVLGPAQIRDPTDRGRDHRDADGPGLQDGDREPLEPRWQDERARLPDRAHEVPARERPRERDDTVEPEGAGPLAEDGGLGDRKSTRLNSSHQI